MSEPFPGSSSPAEPPPIDPGFVITPPKPRRPVWPWIAGAATAFVLVLTCGIVAVASVLIRDDEPEKPTTAAAADVRVGGACSGHGKTSTTITGDPVRCEAGKWRAIAPEGAAEPPPPAPVADPDLSEFSLKLKTKEKQCFGSAGCSVTIQIVAAWATTLDPSVTYELTYEVAGVEDGPLIGTMEITGDQYTVEEHRVSTPKKSTKLSIKATDLARMG